MISGATMFCLVVGLVVGSWAPVVSELALGICQARLVRPFACVGYCGQRYGTIVLF